MSSARIRKPSPIALSRDGNTVWTISDELLINSWSLSDFVKQLHWDNKIIGNAIGVGTITSIDAGLDWIVAGTKSRSVYLFHRTDSKPRLSISIRDEVSSVSPSHDESITTCGTFDGRIHVASIPGGQRIAEWVAHRDEVTSVQFAHDDQLVATGSRDGSLRLWRRDDDHFHPILTLRASGSVESVRFSGDGSRLFGRIRGESGIRVWDLQGIHERLREIDLAW